MPGIAQTPVPNHTTDENHKYASLMLSLNVS